MHQDVRMQQDIGVDEKSHSRSMVAIGPVHARLTHVEHGERSHAFLGRAGDKGP